MEEERAAAAGAMKGWELTMYGKVSRRKDGGLLKLYCKSFGGSNVQRSDDGVMGNILATHDLFCLRLSVSQ